MEPKVRMVVTTRELDERVNRWIDRLLDTYTIHGPHAITLDYSAKKNRIQVYPLDGKIRDIFPKKSSGLMSLVAYTREALILEGREGNNRYEILLFYEPRLHEQAPQKTPSK